MGTPYAWSSLLTLVFQAKGKNQDSWSFRSQEADKSLKILAEGPEKTEEFCEIEIWGRIGHSLE